MKPLNLGMFSDQTNQAALVLFCIPLLLGEMVLRV